MYNDTREEKRNEERLSMKTFVATEHDEPEQIKHQSHC